MNTARAQVIDIPSHLLPGKTKLGHPVTQGTAGIIHALKDRNPISFLVQHRRRCQAGWPRSDDSHAFGKGAGLFRGPNPSMIDDKAFQGTDRDGGMFIIQDAHPLARRRADAPTDRRKGILLSDDGIGGLKMSLPQLSDKPRDIDTKGTPPDTDRIGALRTPSCLS